MDGVGKALRHDTLSVLAKIQERWLLSRESLTTTVYHFGFSETTGVVHAFAYRLTSNFLNSEPLPYNSFVKPECSAAVGFRFPEEHQDPNGDSYCPDSSTLAAEAGGDLEQDQLLC